LQAVLNPNDSWETARIRYSYTMTMEEGAHPKGGRSRQAGK
jgi:hypothetical protein